MIAYLLRVQPLDLCHVGIVIWNRLGIPDMAQASLLLTSKWTTYFTRRRENDVASCLFSPHQLHEVRPAVRCARYRRLLLHFRPHNTHIQFCESCTCISSNALHLYKLERFAGKDSSSYSRFEACNRAIISPSSVSPMSSSSSSSNASSYAERRGILPVVICRIRCVDRHGGTRRRAEPEEGNEKPISQSLRRPFGWQTFFVTVGRRGTAVDETTSWGTCSCRGGRDVWCRIAG